MSFATDEEIEIAHDILLKGKKPFDKSRIDIIKMDNSCYIQACPGSGKTTALLAKLVILANKMPLPDGKGICVLTHTNVAIDEIKARLGQKSDVLFRYPNFFGTIQTFLHKYVTAAALQYFYGSQITYVDNDVANATLLKKYGKLPFENKLKKYIFANIASKNHIIKTDEIELLGGIDTLKSANVIKNIGKNKPKYDFLIGKYDMTNVPKCKQGLIQTKKRNIIDKLGKEFILSFKADWLNNIIKTDSKSISMKTETGREYVNLKEEMFSEGILSFDDAYDLAFRYIQEKNLNFSAFSDKRFKYLFVDEVQDCDNRQVELIKKIFADDKVVIQRFGDYCQAIYDGDENKIVKSDNLKDVLYIHDSNRFGENIARPLRTLCMEDNNLLKGNNNIPSVRPIIITYENPLSVLPKYVELLRSTIISEKGNLSIMNIANNEKQEDPLHRINVKACGWVGKKGATDKKILIESYFPEYLKNNVKSKSEGDFFDDFILTNPNCTVKESATSIIQGILKVMDLCDIKNDNRRYTRTSLLEFLTNICIDKKDEFLTQIMNWTLTLVKGNNEDIHTVKTLIYKYVTSSLLPLFEKKITKCAKDFFYLVREDRQEKQIVEHGNIFHGNGIDIEVETIHAVKGETHASTLYLETFYSGKYESERLFEQLKGVPYKGENAKVLNSLKVAYVGMSRARYLLCVAIHKKRFNKINCPELKNIWDIVES